MDASVPRRAAFRLRILHVDTAREWRGGQVQLLELVRRAPGEHAVAVPPDAPLAAKLLREQVRVEPIAFRGELRGTRALAAAVRSFVPDVVAAHTAHGLAHALRVSAGPVVAHRRVDFRPNAIGRRRLDRAARVIAVSTAVRDVLVASRISAERIAVVRDGVDPVPVPAPVPAPAPAPFVLAAGALVPHKGHATLVAALPLLPGIHVAIAGEGPLRGALLRQAAQLGVADRFHLLGPRSDLPALLASADVVCHPSHEEGLGQVLIEALLLGAPVVACRAGGIPEVVEGRGLLVAPRDPVALAGALRRALADPEELRRLARAASPALRQDFSVDRMTRETMAAYAVRSAS